jgi:hypothetical protein
MGLNKLSGRVILLPEARFDYSHGQIRKFIAMWNDGEPISRIAEYFGIAIYEVSLLIIHCELEEWIGPRPGGLKGTKKHKWKQDRKKK